MPMLSLTIDQTYRRKAARMIVGRDGPCDRLDRREVTPNDSAAKLIIAVAYGFA
jgi:hypothetical protein